MDITMKKQQLKNKLNWLVDGGEVATIEFMDDHIRASLKDGVFHVLFPLPFLFWNFYLYGSFQQANLSDDVIDMLFEHHASLTTWDKVKMALSSIFSREKSMDI